MPRVRNLIQDSVVVEQPIYNNVELTKWIHNGVVVWEKGAYQVEYKGTELFSSFGTPLGTDRKYVGDPYNDSIYSGGDTFEINGLTCTMEGDNYHIFKIKGKATAQTRILYALGTAYLAPALSGQDTDMLCHGLPIDAPDGITIEFTAAGSTEIDSGLGCVVDLGGVGGNISVSSSIVIEEGTALYDIEISPVMRFIYQGKIFWWEYPGTRSYACKSIRYKSVVDYFDGKISEILVSDEWTTTVSTFLDPLTYAVACRESNSRQSISGALFELWDTTPEMADWEITEGNNALGKLLSPYATGEYVLHSTTKDSSNPIYGVVERNNYQIMTDEISGLRQFLNTHNAIPIGSLGSEYLEIIKDSTSDALTGYDIYDSSFSVYQSGSFPSTTWNVWFMGDHFVCLVEYTLHYYKLVRLDLDGTEKDVYDFKNYYNSMGHGFSIPSRRGHERIDLSGVYAFTVGIRAGHDTDIIIIENNDNVYVAEEVGEYFGEWVVGNFDFTYNGIEEAMEITRVAIPIR